jgi:predicted cupin superfamily sugar epimerase
MKNKTAKYWIDKLNLQPHPEGGYYKEVYRSEENIEGTLLPGNRKGVRFVCTAIYFLLEGNDFSAFHRIKSDEIWHFYDGTPLMIYSIDKKGKLKEYLLSNDSPMQIIPKEEWFSAELIDKSSFALVGCTVAPGFDFVDFEMGDKSEMIKLYLDLNNIIERLTR